MSLGDIKFEEEVKNCRKIVKISNFGGNSQFVLHVQLGAQTCTICQTVEASKVNIFLNKKVSVQKIGRYVFSLLHDASGTYQICSIEDICSFNNVDANDAIIQLFSKWAGFTREEKVDTIQSFGCYELFAFVKLRDPLFFERTLKPFILNLHQQQNVVLAWLLEDKAYLRSQLASFSTMNPLDQFLILQSLGDEVPRGTSTLFHFKSGKAGLSESRQQQVMQLFVQNQQNPQQPHSIPQSFRGAAGCRVEQTFFNRADTSLSIRQDGIFSQILNGKVAFPFFSQTSMEASRILVAFLVDSTFSIDESVELCQKAPDQANVIVTPIFTTLDSASYPKAIRNQFQLISFELENKGQQPLREAKLELQVEGVQVYQVHQLRSQFQLDPLQKQTFRAFTISVLHKPFKAIVKLVSENKIVFEQEIVLEIMVTQRQVQEDKLAKLLKVGEPNVQSICNTQDVNEQQFASAVVTLAPLIVDKVVEEQERRGILNKYLMARQFQTSTMAQSFVKQLYLAERGIIKRGNYHQKISPVVEIHPYIRSRMLKPKAVPSQLAAIMKTQLLHTFIRNDLENLFLQAVLSDDFELASFLKPKCRFTKRHQLVETYFECASRKQKAYVGDTQFNTFSSESTAKYGKVKEYVGPFSVLVVGEQLQIHNETGEQAAVFVFRSESQLVLSKKTTSLLGNEVKDHTLQVSKLGNGMKCVLVRTPQFVQLVDIPERSGVIVNRVNQNLIRVLGTESGKPVRCFVEVFNSDKLVQSGYTDVLGMFKVWLANTLVHIWDGDTPIEFHM